MPSIICEQSTSRPDILILFSLPAMEGSSSLVQINLDRWDSAESENFSYIFIIFPRLDRRSTPAVIQDLMGSHVSRIACGRCHTIVVIAGKLYSFGLGSSGQLGNGMERNQISPRLTDESLDHVASIFAGWDQSFFIRQGGVFVSIFSPPLVQEEIWDGVPVTTTVRQPARRVNCGFVAPPLLNATVHAPCRLWLQK